MIPSAVRLREEFVAGERSAVETVRETFARIRQSEPALHAFLSLDEPGALAAAAALDRRRADGESLGSLAGVPIGVKDLIGVRGSRTTCGSRMLAEYIAPYDATVVERLRQADAIIVGKTNLDEFAMGSSNEHSAFGRACNPWDLSLVSGGSSGGSAVAVAADQVPITLGTDTGGSIRQPAAFCGIVGLKPTYGLVSRYGVVAYASSLDQVGPMGRTAADCAALLQAIGGPDRRDSTSARREVGEFSPPDSLRGLRIGWVPEQFGPGLDPIVSESVESALRWFESQGAVRVPVELPYARFGIASYYVIASSEASSNLERFDGAHYGFRADGSDVTDLDRLYRATRTAGFGAEVKRRILLGTFALSAGHADAYYGRASRVRRAIRDDFDRVWQQVDLLLGPTTPTPPFPAAAKTSDPLAMYLADVYTVLANLAGLPAVSFPVEPTDTRLPIGAQLTGPPFSDQRLLGLVHRYQQEHDWHLRRPDPIGLPAGIPVSGADS
ncbi:MAG TPA: Asp-tRNA(Asn)/Glu-tRNA(Gln) amidotransferase GatCAB subunit A [Planctomycetaceae bacterium]|nr:Asp-tRNA(Asn)/Glu-tRNA(Gln) amidotransferase GatCAB subunit A [Planctomycetaceae bacterium]HRE99760.1 Asp-tRNA(Asn)/Glu-tRNA(Gln) amidotransferase subunit GatA [Pirellulaceae bacterium]